tara:strand:+ start:1271 stop:1558 length:288 start_codon:yes stop_codon:yes gene_type:complete
MVRKIQVGSEEVRRISELAKINVEDEKELEIFAKQFEQIISYFEIIETVPEFENENDIKNVLRQDEIENSLSKEEIFLNLKSGDDKGYFKGPKIR